MNKFVAECIGNIGREIIVLSNVKFVLKIAKGVKVKPKIPVSSVSSIDLHIYKQSNNNMTMSDDTPVSTLVLPVLLRPILSQVEFYLFSFHFKSIKFKMKLRFIHCVLVFFVVDFAVGKTRCGCIANTAGGANKGRTSTSRSVL